MQGTRFTVSVHIHGTLAANASGEFRLPCDAALVHVSLSNSAATDAILDLGTSADPDGILADAAVGDSHTPNIFEATDWTGALATAGSPYHMIKGTTIDWDLDFDGSSGTAAANFMMVLTFTEG
jgi:hypothetical protein